MPRINRVYKDTYSGIYTIRNQNNKKQLLGKARDIALAWQVHRGVLLQGKHPCSALQTDWDIYGPKAFSFLILEECQTDDLFLRYEQYLKRLCPQYVQTQHFLFAAAIKSHPPIKKCLYCGKPFVAGKGQKYDSASCRAGNYLKNLPKGKIKQEVLQREHLCAICSWDGNLWVCKIDPSEEYCSENLYLLCSICHAKKYAK